MLALAHDLGLAMRAKADRHVFVFRSTLVPGTVEDVLRPIIEAESGKKDGVDFDVCFQPEFLREGSSIRDYDRPPFTVVGANAPAATARLRELFGHLPCEFHVTSVRSAEMVKYCCNNFHALKITFANETASGWQQMNFATPIAVTANTTYVASYHLNVGFPAVSDQGLAAAVDNGPLHALASGTSGGNGVYAYGASSVFPNQTWNASNYWVDVVFVTTLAPDTTPPTVTGVTPAAGSIS